ncbi:hypothetical protein SAMN02745166_01668 [Prosthecobacter debontii]|uniref:Uncharacterized protein n=1 Tax=Prosthecobacter debontii TaxID=48467 RepID=A0A1T4XM31_9BACT|nr:hypothetical protein SAMN02745166_01668 [Prosthecobacter debontii]
MGDVVTQPLSMTNADIRMTKERRNELTDLISSAEGPFSPRLFHFGIFM